MRSVAARLRPVRDAVVAKVAVMAGNAVRTLPGGLGAGAICWGLSMIYEPLGFIAAGAFLLLLDKRMP